MLRGVIHSLLTWLGQRTTEAAPTRLELLLGHIFYLLPFLLGALVSLDKLVLDTGIIIYGTGVLAVCAYLYLLWAAFYRKKRADEWLATHMIHLSRLYAKLALRAAVILIVFCVTILFAATFPPLVVLPAILAAAALLALLVRLIQGYVLFCRHEPVKLVFKRAEKPESAPPPAGQLHPSLRRAPQND